MSDNTPTTDNTAPSADWINSINDAELRGAITTKGWDKLDPVEAFQQAAKAHRNAEKMLGAPADHLLRLPTRDDDEAGWRNVWSKLGTPEKPEDYDLSGLKFDNPDYDQSFADAIRKTAAELNMPKAMAERMAQSFHKFIDDTGKRVSAENAAALQGEQEKLSADWGAPNTDRFRANMFIADQAAAKLGVNSEVLNTLKNGIGAAAVAQMFHKIGVAMGEDRYVSGGNPANPGPLSRDQAVARRSELMADRRWVDRYLQGGQPELREMKALNSLIAGVD